MMASPGNTASHGPARRTAARSRASCPGWRGRLDAQAEEGQHRLADDRRRDGDGGLHEDHRGRVGQDVLARGPTASLAPSTTAAATKSSDFSRSASERTTRMTPGICAMPIAMAALPRRRPRIAAKPTARMRNGKASSRSVSREMTRSSRAEVAGDEPERHADASGCRDREHADQQRGPDAEQDAREHVPTEVVGAEQVARRAGRRERVGRSRSARRRTARASGANTASDARRAPARRGSKTASGLRSSRRRHPLRRAPGAADGGRPAGGRLRSLMRPHLATRIRGSMSE